MHGNHICSILMLALATSATFIPSLAVAESPESRTAEPTLIRIELDTDAIGDRSLGLEDKVVESLRPIFEAGGIELVEDGREAVHLRIRFGGKAEDVQLFNYNLHFELVEGNTVTRLIDPVVCLDCFDHTLFPTLEETAPKLIEAIDAQRGRDPTAPGTEPPHGEQDPGKSPPPRPIGVMGGVGIGVAALGVGGLVWGAVDLARGQVYGPASEDETRLVWTDYGPRGAVILGVGVAGVVLGGALLATDLVIRARQRKSANQPSSAFAPVLSPQVVGLGWIRRF
jgi:hypothetical protein